MADKFTAETLMQWIEDNTRHLTDLTPTLEAACWFCAVQDAEAIREWSSKELAREIVEGAVFGPYDEVEHVQKWLDDLYEGWVDEEIQDIQDIHDQLMYNLRKHFGLI
jgi:hypothetical protein